VVAEVEALVVVVVVALEGVEDAVVAEGVDLTVHLITFNYIVTCKYAKLAWPSRAILVWLWLCCQVVVEDVEAVAALTVAREATLLETALRFNSMMFFHWFFSYVASPWLFVAVTRY
jgi:hypothetical protein